MYFLLRTRDVPINILLVFSREANYYTKIVVPAGLTFTSRYVPAWFAPSIIAIGAQGYRDSERLDDKERLHLESRIDDDSRVNK